MTGPLVRFVPKGPPMSFSLRRSVPAALLVGGLVVVSGTSGAVAGGMITGKNIQDNTVTSDDVKDLSLRASDTSSSFDKYMRRVAGYKAVRGTTGVSPGTQGDVIVQCPGETRLLGAQAWWTTSIDPVQVEVQQAGGYTKTVRAYGLNSGSSDDVINLVAFCGRTAT